jgi:hypothetical protein
MGTSAGFRCRDGVVVVAAAGADRDGDGDGGLMTYKADFTDMVARVMERIDHAEQEYGNKSLFSPTGDLLKELEEETLDIMGWGFYVWKRVRALREKFERVGVL